MTPGIDDAAITMRLGQYVMGQAVAVALDSDAPLAACVGVTVQQIIACALRNPEWGHWFRLSDEQVPEDEGCEIEAADMDLMKLVPVGIFQSQGGEHH